MSASLAQLCSGIPAHASSPITLENDVFVHKDSSALDDIDVSKSLSSSRASSREAFRPSESFDYFDSNNPGTLQFGTLTGDRLRMSCNSDQKIALRPAALVMRISHSEYRVICSCSNIMHIGGMPYVVHDSSCRFCVYSESRDLMYLSPLVPDVSPSSLPVARGPLSRAHAGDRRSTAPTHAGVRFGGGDLPARQMAGAASQGGGSAVCGASSTTRTIRSPRLCSSASSSPSDDLSTSSMYSSRILGVVHAESESGISVVDGESAAADKTDNDGVVVSDRFHLAAENSFSSSKLSFGDGIETEAQNIYVYFVLSTSICLSDFRVE